MDKRQAGEPYQWFRHQEPLSYLTANISAEGLHVHGWKNDGGSASFFFPREELMQLWVELGGEECASV